MRRVHLVETGGTFGSSLREGAISPDPTESVPDLAGLLPPETVLSRSSPFRILSEDATSAQWTELARHVAALPLDRIDAVVVAHGSDTLAWTSAALAYLLRGVPRPVVLTASDRPLSHPAANGLDNFRSAVAFGLSESLPGVFVAWGEHAGPQASIHLGARLLPADPYRDRFASAGGVAFGTVDRGVFSRLAHPSNPTRSQLASGADRVRWELSRAALESGERLFEDLVLVLPDQPGVDHAPLLPGLSRWKAIVQIAHHSGTASAFEGSGSFLDLARRAREAGIPVLLGPCRRGEADYASSLALDEHGVIRCPSSAWPALVVKCRRLVSLGVLAQLSEAWAWEILPDRSEDIPELT